MLTRGREVHEPARSSRSEEVTSLKAKSGLTQNGKAMAHANWGLEPPLWAVSPTH
jgi:hypothetical protein